MKRSHTVIDDMEYNDEEGHLIPLNINVLISCTKCYNLYPLESTEWGEDAYYIKIKPHVCVWFDDDLKENLDRITKELLSDE